MKEIQESGTRWPIPSSWEQSKPGVYEGKEGLLKVVVEDGDLIDPGRCRSANEIRAADWHLVRTSNGTAVTATYSDSGARVQVFAVRADERDLGGLPLDGLPEVRATYVLAGNADAILSELEQQLQQRTVSQEEYGSLDTYGHAAMGPVPVIGAWSPIGESEIASDAVAVSGRASYLTLVGGGWIMLADDTRCCGVMLQPLAWRRLYQERIEDLLKVELSNKGLTVHSTSLATARVWGCAISEHGHSYTAKDAADRLRAVDAFWQDAFGQAWRLHYWLDPQHGCGVEQMLTQLCSGSRGAVIDRAN
jgi:hypothetical protein